MLHYDFCTLFDRNYLYKGLALYRSLVRTCPDFTLWVLCMDDTVYHFLAGARLTGVRLIALSDFEDDELLRIKPTRSPVEYCWTCTPSLLLYILKNNPQCASVTYLDADLFFYRDPQPVYQEFSGNSILIVEHRYPPRLEKYAAIYGRYNVQFLAFRNDPVALACLARWRKQCNDWCYLKYEAGKWGDQKYLDDWPMQFKGVRAIAHPGAGVAPWNVAAYSVKKAEGKIFIDHSELVFYHFHQLDIITPREFDLTRGYKLSPGAIEHIYMAYLRELNGVISDVAQKDQSFHHGYSVAYDLRPSSLVTAVKSRVLRNPLIKNIARTCLGWCMGKYYYRIKLDA